MVKKKVFTGIIVFISVLSIVFSLLYLTGVLPFANKEEPGSPKEIAKWTSGKLGNEKSLFVITIYDNNEVNVCVTDSTGSTNGFFPLEQLTECDYRDEIVFWCCTYEKSNTVYASIVPENCAYAEINGKKYYPKSAKITADGIDYEFKYITAVFEVMTSEVEIGLVDNNGKEYAGK